MDRRHLVRQREQQPADSRFPEKAMTADRVDSFDLEAVERFHAMHQGRRKI
ncbi:hypothetical protein [Streptomyces sp. NPDC051561]|uniref:hypothetical protein n=1 Tax=Streptomyces sp. NPDC051561 TaxID=3365658 RepID=UPI0037878D74